MPNSRRIAILIACLGFILLAGGAALILLTSSPAPSNTPLAVAFISRSEGTNPEISRVTITAAKTAYDAKAAIFVDTRPMEYYDESHIPGALNMPEETIPPELAKLPKDTWIITYCT